MKHHTIDAAIDLARLEVLMLSQYVYGGFPVGHMPVLPSVDVYTMVAAEMFSVPVEKVTAEQRQVAKARNYLLAYGGN